MKNYYTFYGEDKLGEEICVFLEKREDKITNDPFSRENCVLRSLGEASPGRNRLLDYGCGWGYISRHASLMGWQVTASDISENELAIARLMHEKSRINKEIIYSHCPIESYSPGTYDVVISIEVIEHVHNPGLYLSRINNVLKHGGKLIISIPNIMTIDTIFSHLYKTFTEGLYKTSQKTLSTYHKAHDHIHSWDALHFTRLLSSLGFQLESYTPMEHWPLPPFLKKIDKPILAILRNIPRFQNFRYSLLFVFTKVNEANISAYD